MNDVFAPVSRAALWAAGRQESRQEAGHDGHRWLQLGLAALWLLDAVLQFQPFMFGAGFARMLGTAAHGNPVAIAAPVSWMAGLTGQHPVAANMAFGAIQLLLALGIAWRPTARIALAASVAWALGVWWLGEGLGGVLTPAASPVTGAPGAALLYALLAVLLWPARRAPAGDDKPGRDQPGRAAPFPAGRALGPAAARAVWVLLWGGIAWLAVAGAAASGLPAPWPFLLAAGCCLIAAGIMLPAPGVRLTVVLAVITALVMWAAGQDFGGIGSGMATDPGTGPLLALLALAYWPSQPARPARPPLPATAASSGHTSSSSHTAGYGIVVMQVVMAVAMAAMLVPWLDPLPRAGWMLLAGTGTAWFSWRFLREAVAGRTGGPGPFHFLPHALACGAMLTMLAAGPGTGSAASSLTAAAATGQVAAMAHPSVLALLLAVAMLSAVVVTADRLTGPVPTRAGPAGQAVPVPRLASCCQIAMSVAMAYLLIQMV